MSKSTATFWFWSVIGLFAAVWVLLPSLLHTGYKPDVIELQFIGKEWVLATNKHPMLPAWILETLNILTGRAFAAPFIAAALCTVIILFSVWRLARKVLPERLALMSTFVMLPFWAITVESTKYNQNSVLMACWALTILMFYNAFQTNKKRWWIAAGLTLGLGLHAKYTMILLAIAILLYSLLIPRFRRYWKEIGPWITVLVSFAVFLPHLIWLHQVGFGETTSYALADQQGQLGIGSHFHYPVEWIVSQFGLILISPLLLLLPYLGLKWKIRTPQSGTEKETLQYLLYCMAFPFLAILIAAAVARINTVGDDGYPLWFFLGVYLLLRFQRQESMTIFRWTLSWTSLAVFAMVVVFIIQALVSPYLTDTPRRFHFPMQELGAKCDEIWASRFPDSPCPYITGDFWLAGNAAYAMRDRPSVHFYCWTDPMEDPESAPTGTWSTDEDVNQRGGIILWHASEQIPDWIHLRFPRAEILPETLELSFRVGTRIPPVRIGIAVVPPS